MRVMFFGDDREGAINALKFLIEKEIEVVGCVFEEDHSGQLRELCERNGITCHKSVQVYNMLENEELPMFDLGVSYLYRKIIKTSLIGFCNNNIINFHPAPIQIHKGIAACCYCLLNGYKEWGVTAHYIAPAIDEGDIIMERTFSVAELETSMEVEDYVQKQSLKLFKDVIMLFINGEKIPRKQQDLSKGHFFSKKELEKEKTITILDSAQKIDQKIKALWFPPYHGANIEIDGKKYSLVNEEILKEIAELYQKARKQGELYNTNEIIDNVKP